MKRLLQAVNKMLNSINEDNVETDLELAEHLQGQLALETLERNKRNVLSEGWDFNTDDNWEFSPDQSGSIGIPQNVLDVASYDRRYMMRDWRMYDKLDKTYNIGKIVPCRVIWELDFDDLTHPIARYITAMATREFQMTIIGDTTVDTKIAEEENKAKIVLAESEDLTAQHNILTDNEDSVMFTSARRRY